MTTREVQEILVCPFKGLFHRWHRRTSKRTRSHQLTFPQVPAGGDSVTFDLCFLCLYSSSSTAPRMVRSPDLYPSRGVTAFQHQTRLVPVTGCNVAITQLLNSARPGTRPKPGDFPQEAASLRSLGIWQRDADLSWKLSSLFPFFVCPRRVSTACLLFFFNV